MDKEGNVCKCMGFDRLEDDVSLKIDMISEIRQDIAALDRVMAPIQVLKKLSPNPRIYNEDTFQGMTRKELVQQIKVMSVCLHNLKLTMKHRCENLDDLYPLFEREPSQLDKDVSEIKTKVETIVTTKPPEPVDYAAAVVAKLPAQTQPVNNVNVRKEVKQVSEEQIRSQNLIIYNVPYAKAKPLRASECAKQYFTSCGVAAFHLETDKIVDAVYLSITEDQTMCNLKVMMSNPMVVRSLLSVTRLLKTSDSTKFGDRNFDFSKSYVSKDRTKLEQEQHKKLILELKMKISEDPSTRWIIKYGRIVPGGSFQS